MTYYKIIGGVRYERSLLDAADRFSSGQGEYRISLEEIQQLYTMASDGRVITEVEQRTLLYIGQQYLLTTKAKNWLLEQFPQPGGDNLEKTIDRVLRQEYGLLNLQCQLSPETIARYESWGGKRTFQAVLRGAIDAFLKGNWGILSLEGCVSRHDSGYNESLDKPALLKKYLDRGVLFLIPPDKENQENLPYDLPHVLDPEHFWCFAFTTEDFEPVEFFAFVHRDQQHQYSQGQFSKKAEHERLVTAVIRQFAQFPGLKWNIPADEVQRQMAILPGQNFGNALFSAVFSGIFNRESSFSLGDFVQQEVWVSPDSEIDQYIVEYADAGTIHLIPLDYRAQTDAGTASFPVPERFSFWTDGEWVFGLEMPSKTTIRTVVTTPREGNDGQTAWNDSFVEDTRSVEEQLQHVLHEEFNLKSVELVFSEEEFNAQRLQLGQDWRYASGLLRQALNTALHDYTRPSSIFNIVAQVHSEELDPHAFEDIREYRMAIRERIHQYLDTAFIELLPIELPDNNPIDGEKIEDSWQFFMLLRALSDHGFWVIIPRWPDDDQQPYLYGVN